MTSRAVATTATGRRLGVSVSWSTRSPATLYLECHSMALPCPRGGLKWGQPAYIPARVVKGAADELDALIRALTWVRENL